jgi:uncharacterized protein
MIRNTFCILDGIGERLERRLWKEGILTWEDFTDAEQVLGFSTERKRLFDESLFLTHAQLKAGNSRYFHRKLRPREHWRLFEFFKGEAVCLDIETNGFQPKDGGYATVVGLYNGYDYKRFIRGENLSAESLNRELEKYKCLITFYGAAFDIPFLLRDLGGINFDMPHFDLCFASKRLGLKGGLKKLEDMLGIERDESVKGLNGYDAVKLWDTARRGHSESMDRLVTYNREDTVNLMRLASILYEKLKESTGIEEYLACGAA